MKLGVMSDESSPKDDTKEEDTTTSPQHANTNIATRARVVLDNQIHFSQHACSLHCSLMLADCPHAGLPNALPSHGSILRRLVPRLFPVT